MKFLICMILSLSPFALFAEDDGQFFKTNEKNMGIIRSGTPMVTATFDFENLTGHTVVINEVKKTCGCVSVSFPQKPISEGEKGCVKVTIDLEGYEGPLCKRLLVYAEGLQPVILKVKANIK